MGDTVYKEEIFEFVFMCALRDATAQKAYADTLDSLDQIRDFLRNEVKQYIDQIFNKNKPIPDPMEVIDNIAKHKKLLDFNKTKAENYKKFKFGNIQKLVNMTAKYMYIATYTNGQYRERFRKCHCPIDSKISQKIYDKCEEKEIDFKDFVYFPDEYKKSRKRIKTFFYTMSFSKISEKDYRYCQEIVNKYCIDTGIYPIEFDYIFWK